MGYVHGWEWRRELKEDRDLRLEAVRYTIHDMGKIMHRLPPLGDLHGKGEPILDPGAGVLVFNGREPDDYEPFQLTPEDGDRPSYLKTGSYYQNRRPYDLAVMVALTLLRWHAGEGVRVISDGNVGAWAPATELVSRELGYPVDPFFVLEREVYTFRDRAGRVFALEGGQEEDPEEILWKFLRVNDLYVREGLFPYRLQEPFTLLPGKGLDPVPGESYFWWR